MTPTTSAAILVIDDDQAIRDTLRLALEDSHYRVLEAADGIAGLAALTGSTEPLIVLLDQYMPHLDGIGMLTQLAAAPLPVKHGFIMMTASPQSLPPDMSPIQQHLSVRLMPKPFDIDKLLDTVEDVAHELTTPAP